MFGTIRKHQQWLWVLIVAAVIISFVVWFSPNQPSLRNLGRGSDLGSIDGQPITREQWIHAQQNAQIRRMLYGGDRPNADLDQEVARDILITSKVRQNQIVVGDDAVASWIKKNLRDPRSGQIMYDTLAQDLKGKGVSEALFLEFIRGEIARQHLIELAGVAGKLIPPREAEEEFKRDHEESLASVVHVASSNFLGAIQIDPAAVSQFYSNRIAAYRIPERLQVTYLRFEKTNHLAEAEKELAGTTDLTNRLESAYQQRGADSFRDPEGKVMSRDAAVASLYSQERDAAAVRAAQRTATDFFNELAAIEPVKPENLDALAGKKGLMVGVTPPFSQFSIAAGLEDLTRAAQESFALTAESPFTLPLASERGVTILGLKSRIPSEIQPLDQIKDRVEDDYRRNKAFEMVRAAGNALYATLTNGLAQGKSFLAIATELGYKPIELPAFAPSSTTLPSLDPGIDLATLKNAVANLKPGDVSPFIFARDGGLIVQLRERKPVDPEKMKKDFPNYLADLRRQNSMVGFYDWFQHEYERSGLQRLFRKTDATSAPAAP